ncbi:MAG: MmgE/PrpD family protein, partial [Acidimicrobiales bacterium]
MTNTPTRALAAFASGLRYDELPEPVVQRVKESILDTLGCGLFGSTLPWTRILVDVVAAEGAAPAATIWGTPLRTSPASASLVNGTSSHGFELDDVHHRGAIHPGAVILPAVLALAEARGATGRDVLVAMVAGVEVGGRVGASIAKSHFRAGFHPQGTVGTFAAGAAAGRITGADVEQMINTLGTAGSQAAGLMAAQEGSMVKRLHSGRAAQSGVYSALLAERGFTGIADVLEAEFGGFLTTMGGGEIAHDELTAGLGRDWETLGIGFKRYAACAASHTSLDIAEALRIEGTLRDEDIASVCVRVGTHTFVHCGWPYDDPTVTG